MKCNVLVFSFLINTIKHMFSILRDIQVFFFFWLLESHSTFVLLVKFQYFYSYFIKRKMAEETGLLALLEEMLVRIAKYLGKRTN